MIKKEFEILTIQIVTFDTLMERKPCECHTNCDKQKGERS